MALMLPALLMAVLGLAPLTDRQLRQFIGPPLRETFASLGLGPADVEAAIVAYRAHFSDVGLYENTPYPGIEVALRELVAGGLRNRDVATRLGISEGTAKLHLNVYKKLGVANRVELVLRMRNAGLLD